MKKIDFLKKKKTFTKDNVQPDPNVYWVAIFSFGFLLTIFAVLIGLYVFRGIEVSDSADYARDDRQSQKISKKRIDAALNIFSDRQKASEEIINSGSPIVDPSL